MDASPLGRMPPEIRNMIYGYITHEPERIRVGVDKDGRLISAARWLTRYRVQGGVEPLKTPEVVRLFRVCREMRSETRGLYFSDDGMVIFAWHWSRYSTVRAIVDWLRLIANGPREVRPPSVCLYLGSVFSVAPSWGNVREISDAFHPGVKTKNLLLTTMRDADPCQSPSSPWARRLPFGDRDRATQRLDSWWEQNSRRSVPGRTTAKHRRLLTKVEATVRLWLERMPGPRDDDPLQSQAGTTPESGS